MGKRLIITVEALLRANCALIQKIVHHEASPPEDLQQIAAWNEHLLKVTFPNGYEKYFDFATHADKAWVECDYNDYGPTKQVLAPVLAEFKIAHLVH
jgi:hypothetical protein